MIIILLNVATIVAAIIIGLQVQDKLGEVEISELETKLSPIIMNNNMMVEGRSIENVESTGGSSTTGDAGGDSSSSSSQFQPALPPN